MGALQVAALCFPPNQAWGCDSLPDVRICSLMFRFGAFMFGFAASCPDLQPHVPSSDSQPLVPVCKRFAPIRIILLRFESISVRFATFSFRFASVSFRFASVSFLFASLRSGSKAYSFRSGASVRTFRRFLVLTAVWIVDFVSIASKPNSWRCRGVLNFPSRAIARGLVIDN